MAKLGATHFEGSKWVRRTPHFFALRTSWVRCGATMKKVGAKCGVRRTLGCDIAPRTAPVMLRDGAFKNRVRCGATRGQRAVRLKIVKVRGAMSKVRRTHFFNEWVNEWV